MVLFLQIAKHSPENCPLHNQTVKKVYVNYNAKLGELTKKHGIKMVGGWASMPEHLTVTLFEAPDPGAMIKFMREPQIIALQSYHFTQTRPVVTFSEAMKSLK